MAMTDIKNSTPSSANPNKDAPIDNAGDVIKRFGGIRPMAKKIGVAVTTIQGWKKRDVIPANRRESVLAAAQEHGIDLPGLMVEQEQIANENVESLYSDENFTQSTQTYEAQFALEEAEELVEESFEAAEEQQEDSQKERPKPVSFEELKKPVLKADNEQKPLKRAAVYDMDDLDQKIASLEQSAVTKSTWIGVVLIVLSVAAVGAFFWPLFQDASKAIEANGILARSVQKDVNNVQGDVLSLEGRVSGAENNVSALRGEVAQVQEQQSLLDSSFKGLIPQDWQGQMDELRTQAEQMQGTISGVMQQAEQISQNFQTQDAAVVAGQLANQAQDAVQNIIAGTSFGGMTELVERFSMMQTAEEGQAQGDVSVARLADAFAMAPIVNDENVNSIIDQARVQSAELGETLDGVPQNDLKAAALLLGLSQFRSAVNRGEQNFENDLSVLQNLVGHDSPELQAAITRLAPHAASGVLTSEGLSREFRTIAGEVVIASLQGQDVSIGEKAKARLNEVLQVEKNGELITGTETQAKVAKSQALMEEGDLASAVAILQTLNGPEAQVIRPWLNKAQASLLADNVMDLSVQTLATQQGSGSIVEAAKALIGYSSILVQNDATGINILNSGQVYQPR